MFDSFQKLLDAIDDFLIDRVAQPICDKVRKTTGWSKRIPIVGAIFLMTICFILMAFAFYKIGDFYRWIGVPPFLCALPLIGLMLTLIYDEVSEEENTPILQNIMEQGRHAEKHSRRTTLLMWVTLYPFGILALSLLPGIRDIGLYFLLLGIGEFVIPYFVVCTDIPPGKTFLLKCRRSSEQ